MDQYVKSWHRRDLRPDYHVVRKSFPRQTEELVKIMERFGRPKPIWITEICWNSHIHPYGTSELRQAVNAGQEVQRLSGSKTTRLMVDNVRLESSDE